MIVGLFAIFIRDYVTLQWVVSLVCYIQIPLWFFLPESPRWLLSKGRVDEAKEIMTKAAKWNKREVDLSGLKEYAESTEMKDELGFKDLFTNKDILIITVVMTLNWPIISMAYYGLGLSMTQLGGNLFVSFVLGALIEVRNLRILQKAYNQVCIRSQAMYCVHFLLMFGEGSLSLSGKFDDLIDYF